VKRHVTAFDRPSLQRDSGSKSAQFLGRFKLALILQAPPSRRAKLLEQLLVIEHISRQLSRDETHHPAVASAPGEN
jgi:hypothetical protein